MKKVFEKTKLLNRAFQERGHLVLQANEEERSEELTIRTLVGEEPLQVQETAFCSHKRLRAQGGAVLLSV